MLKAAWFGLVAALVLNTGGAAPQARPQQLTSDPADRVMVHELLVWIVENTDYKMPSVEPDLERLSGPTMAELACGSTHVILCPVLGLHYTGSYNIFIHVGLDAVNARHVTLHELVHYLQSRADPNLGGCKRLERDENEAYALQYLFRVKTQQYAGPPPTTQILCGPNDAI